MKMNIYGDAEPTKEAGIGNGGERKGRNRKTAVRKNTCPKVSMRIISLVMGKAMIRLKLYGNYSDFRVVTLLPSPSILMTVKLVCSTTLCVSYKLFPWLQYSGSTEKDHLAVKWAATS